MSDDIFEYETIAYSRVSEIDGKIIYGTCTVPYSHDGLRSFFSMERKGLFRFEDVVKKVKDPKKHKHKGGDDGGLGVIIACVGGVMGNYHTHFNTKERNGDNCAKLKTTSDIIKHCLSNEENANILGLSKERLQAIGIIDKQD